MDILLLLPRGDGTIQPAPLRARISVDPEKGGRMAYEFAIYEKKGHIATITMNRPHVMNAVHPPATAEWSAIWDAVGRRHGQVPSGRLGRRDCR